jgi:hypothetical protein
VGQARVEIVGTLLVGISWDFLLGLKMKQGPGYVERGMCEGFDANTLRAMLNLDATLPALFASIVSDSRM